MKRALSFGTIDVPTDWEDCSQFQFLSPAATAASVPLAPSAKVAQVRASIVLALAASGSADRLAHELEAASRASLRGYKLLTQEPWSHPRLGALPAFEFVFEMAPGLRSRQAQVFVPYDDTHVVVVTFACDELSFEARRAEFVERLATLALERRPGP